MQRIPVHLVTGFLGAGKTTFLNHFIRSLAPERIFVIENEVGKINVDSQLVMNSDEDIAGLTAGCLCCSLSDELLAVLEQVSARRAEYDRLVIETTGIADPSSIVQTFISNPGVERVFALEQVICLADAEYLEDSLAETDEARRQLACADVVLLNKCDKVDAAYAQRVRDMVLGIHPTLRLFEGQQGVFPVDEILAIRPFQEAHILEAYEQVGPQHQHKHHDITTFTLTFDRPFQLDALAHDLMKLAVVYRHQVYRIKGVLAVNNTPTRVIVQSVRDNFALSDGPPWAAGEVRESKIVFIGKGVERKSIERLLERHLL